MEDKVSNWNGFSVPAKNVSYPRVGHKVIPMEEYAYIFGGIGFDGSFVKNVLKFNLEKLRIQSVPTENYLGIEGFSLFSYMGLIFLWGGNTQDKTNPSRTKVSNTLWCFDGKKFNISEQSGQIPAPRSFHCYAWVANRFLLTYGGYSDNEFFSDWNILDMKTMSWSNVKNSNKLSVNGVYQLGWMNGRGILLKSQSVIQKGLKLNSVIKNQLFEVRITNFNDFTIKIDSLVYFQKEIPPQRSEPTLIFTGRQIYMLGGIKDIKHLSTKAGIQNQFCKDFWVFDFQGLQWTAKPINLSVQYKFQAIKYKNKVFSFGGIKTSSMQLSAYVQVTLLNPQENLIEEKICQFCRCIYGVQKSSKQYNALSNFIPISQQEDPEDPVAIISTSFITKISELLQNPLQAIALLIDNSLNMSASTISIKLQKQKTGQFNKNKSLSPIPSKKNNKAPLVYFKEEITYLYIGDNSQLFYSDEFIRIFHILRWKAAPITPDIIYNEQIRLQNQYVMNLKLAALRLGKTCLYVTKTANDDILVLYFSDDSHHAPDGQKPLNCFYYKLTANGANRCEKSEEYICSNKIDREIIRSNVGHILNEKQFLNTSSHTTKIYIFDLYDIVETQLNYTPVNLSKNWQNFMNSQTQSENQTKFDIGLAYANGGQNSNLHQFVAKLYLTSYLGREIFIQNSKIIFLDVSHKFKQDCQNQLIEKIELPQSQILLFKKCSLFKITSINYSYGVVLVYHENRLITVINTKQHNLCGFIEIPNEIQVDIFKSKIAKIQDSRKLMHYLSTKQQDPKKMKLNRQQLFQNPLNINTNKQIGRKINNNNFQLYHLN